ncbi:TfoX/Sxy family protein [Isoptericola variabilis]|uniref:TfoX N-terminal domain-containing protein n=1 Tax=Isoptericola variabilis (strain 225) TaxID=743718 RepID=F6FX22_ISOV2|nr:TfoX/Sxy family protein [Isoptericola variabilis]AEG44622.1 hypothetical protein Isova_1878 [Isoptericola variabilis 225]TWH28074.1 TfoX-like protein [Isoptericola variabilis J7]
MAYDEELAERVRDAIGRRTEFTEQKMFGGVAFMVNTHMAVGIGGDELMVRVGTDGYEQAWVDRGVDLALSEPPKKPKKPKAPKTPRA